MELRVGKKYRLVRVPSRGPRRAALARAHATKGPPLAKPNRPRRSRSPSRRAGPQNRQRLVRRHLPGYVRGTHSQIGHSARPRTMRSTRGGEIPPAFRPRAWRTRTRGPRTHRRRSFLSPSCRHAHSDRRGSWHQAGACRAHASPRGNPRGCSQLARVFFSRRDSATRSRARRGATATATTLASSPRRTTDSHRRYPPDASSRNADDGC